jgi:uncharacterized membrane protein YdjX (TVP38/TMEM64 family)
MDAIAGFVENQGALTYVLAPLFMVVVAVLPIPAEIPAMVNGMVFGSLLGVGITWGGAVIGAMISFELSRRFGRPLGERLLAPEVLAKADQMVLSAGWPGMLTLRLIPVVAFGMLTLRLIPVVAFTAINWAAGLTPVSRWTFFWTTTVGILPGALVFTLSGSGLGWFYRRHPELMPLLILLIAIVGAVTALRYRRSGDPHKSTT